jgi:prepilin-type N-terminal cleavage/methylation domain-containing protein
MHKRKFNPGFTIVELLVVIVVIAILAAISLIAYASVTNRAVIASLQSDLTNNATLLKNYNAFYGSFPTALDGSNCPTVPTSDSSYCLRASSGNNIAYSTIFGKTFHLTATNNNASYSITDTTAPAIATTPTGSSVGNACPTGFIPVPGSGTYSTNDFCVMRYEAKADNGSGTGDTSQTTGYNTWPADTYPISASRKLVSTAAGYPVVNIAQTAASTAASNYTKDCTGCHLISEAEWMTIAQNVMSVNSNWDNGSGVNAVGTGYIYSGHNDGDPATALQASPADTSGYYYTGSLSGSQKRILNLNNGESIWDFSGNVWEWTSGQTTGGQPGVVGETGFGWKQWTAVTASGSLAVNPFPSGTGLPGSSGWNSGQGVGQLYSYVGDTTQRGFLRGGYWNSGSSAGVLCLGLSSLPGSTGTSYGLRASR